jgi:hypothetical protein
MSIGERIKEVLELKLGKKGKIVAIERLSGINKSSWNSALSGKQRPTAEMIQFVCREWPEYAFWLCTGYLADSSVKHTSPKKEQALDLDLDINELLKKEPIDWSNDELKFAHIKVAEDHNEVVSHDLFHKMLKRSKNSYSEYQYFCSPLKIAYDARIEEKLLNKFIEDMNAKFEEKIANPAMVKGLDHVLQGWRQSQENFKKACDELMKIRK